MSWEQERAVLAQIKAAVGHAGEVSHYTVDALLSDAGAVIERLLEALDNPPPPEPK